MGANTCLPLQVVKVITLVDAKKQLSTYFWSAVPRSAHDFGLLFRCLELCVYARYSGGVVGVARRLDGVKVSDADLVALLQRDTGAEGEGVALRGAVGGDEDVARCVREGSMS